MFAAEPIGPAGMDPALTVPSVLFLLVLIFAAAKAMGEVAERLGQPAVAGEIVAGVVLGGSVLGIIDPADPTIHLFSEIGVVMLLFTIGLETDLGRLLRVGATSATVALAGVALPFALGFGASILFGLDALPALVVGAALTATSVGITARVLSDLGRLQDQESQVIIGAAVIDDVAGLVLLAVVLQVLAGDGVSAAGVAMTTFKAFGFVGAILLIGRPIIPRIFNYLSLLGRPETVAAMAVALAFLCAFLADLMGSALIIGAFVAGLLIQPSPYARPIEHGVGALARLFIPVFFVSVGAAVDVRAFLDPWVLAFGGALIVTGVLGKVLAGYAPVRFRGRKSVVGVGMIPRGEVGLIFAQAGLVAGALTPAVFSAVMLMVIVTTLLGPALLRWQLGGRPDRKTRPKAPGKLSELMTEV